MNRLALLVLGVLLVVSCQNPTNNATYRVIYHPNGASTGTVPVDNNIYAAGTDVYIQTNVNGLGEPSLNFTSWNTDPSGTGLLYTPGSYVGMPANNLNIYAQWSSKPSHSILFDPNEGTGTMDAISVVEDLFEPLPMNSFTRAGYSFNHWTTESEGGGSQYNNGSDIQMGTSDITLYAQWTDNPVHQISFFPNGGTGSMETVSVAEGVTIILPENTYSSLESYFSHWDTSSDDSGDEYANKASFTMQNGDVELYAQWYERPIHTVTFNENYSGGTITQIQVVEGHTVTLIIPNTREGFEFNNWYMTDSNHDASSEADFSDPVMSELTFYAGWDSLVSKVFAGDRRTMILKTDGSFWATGMNNSGQLGDGTVEERHSPVLVMENNVVDVSCGTYHTMFLTENGGLWGMGDNRNGRLGDGTTIERHTPVEIVSSGVEKVSAGGSHTLFIKSDDSLWGMGLNEYGQLCDGMTTDQYSPKEIFSSGIVSVSSGDSHSMILKSDGSLWTVGHNFHGLLGNDTTDDQLSPIQIEPSGVIEVFAGTSCSMYIKSDGSLWGMGYNARYLLGDGTNEDRLVPVNIVDSGVVAVAIGTDNVVLLISDGSTWGHGMNLFGELGLGETGIRSSSVQIDSSGINFIGAGSNHTVWVNVSYELFATGYNHTGQLGDGTTTDQHSPIEINF